MNDKLKMQTPSRTDENFAALAALFPNAVTESIDENGVVVRAIDKDVLTQEINAHVVEGKEERYQFTWPDKKSAALLANAPIAAALRPARAESVDFDSTENLYIEGDNLDVLKLLRETYLNRVKMIYIDPPYNTGNDFIYDDDFSADSDEYKNVRSGDFDEEGNRMVRNLDTNGRFHTDWLNMIYPRLRVARDLLTDDGVIFISIDDNEVAQLRKICDEIFGEGNFVANIVWQKKYGPANDSTTVSPTHDHILAYSKSITKWQMGLFSRDESQMSAFKNPDNDPRGLWRASDLSARSYSATCDYAITSPTGELFRPPASRSWIVNPQRYQELLADNRITFGASGNGRPMQKKFLSEVRGGITPETWWTREFAGDNKSARYEMKALFPENVFDTPKPSKLIYRLLQVANVKENDSILDFFSGSATTAHAVMQLNAEDGGKRKFIMVQLPEACAEESEAFKAGYKNICEIGKERIRRAGRKIVDSGQWTVDSKQPNHSPLSTSHYNKEDSDECSELQRADCLAKIHATDDRDLSAGEETAEGGDLRAVRSDAQSGGVYSLEHSGGAGAELNERIRQLSFDSAGFNGGSGDAALDMPKTGIPDRTGYKTSAQPSGRDKQNAHCPHQKTNHCPLTTVHCLDTGFRVLKLDSSNMKEVYYTPQDYAKPNLVLGNLIDNIKEDRSGEDLLFQVMLDLGIPLSAKIQMRNVEFGMRNESENNSELKIHHSEFVNVFDVANGYLVACFEAIDETIVTEIAKKKPYYVVFRDSSFSSDSALVNFEQIFKTYSPTTIRKVL